MDIMIRSKRLHLTPTFTEQIHRELDLILGRFQPRIGDVSVRLSDATGRRGGIHTRCRISVQLNGLGSVVGDDTDENLASAVNHAVHLVQAGVIRTLDRTRQWHVGFPQPDVAKA